MKKSVQMGVFILVLSVLMLFGFYSWQAYQKHVAQGEIESSGTIETYEVEVGSQVGGRIEQVVAQEGDSVKEGTLLIKIEPYQLPQKKKQAQAQYAQALVQFQELKNGPRKQEIALAQAHYLASASEANLVKSGASIEDIRQTEARHRQAKADFNEANSRYSRMKSLWDRKVISALEFDVARARYSVAKEQLEAAKQAEVKIKRGNRSQEIETSRQQALGQKAQLDLLKAGTRVETLKAQKALVTGLEARVGQLNVMMRELQITSPCNCEVSGLDIRKGQIVLPNQTVATLINLDDLWIRVYIPEERFGKVHPGDIATINVDSYPEQTFTGKVIQVATQAEFTPRNVQTEKTRRILVFGVKVAIDNSKRLLRPGMPADVTFDVPRDK